MTTKTPVDIEEEGGGMEDILQVNINNIININIYLNNNSNNNNNNDNNNNDNTMSNKPGLRCYPGQSQRRQRRERSAWTALTWPGQRCTPVGHHDNYGEDHGEDHGKDHSEDLGENHDEDHDDNHGVDHGDDHETVVRCVKEAEAHAEDGDKDKKHREGAGLLIKLSTAVISKFPKLEN